MNQDPEPGNRSAARRVIAAEARAKMKTLEQQGHHLDEVTPELFRVLPRRGQSEQPMETLRDREPQASADEPGIKANMTVDRQHKHRDLWVTLAGALIVGGLTLAVTIWAAENSQPHVGFWPHAGEIGGLALTVLGGFLAVAVVSAWWLPGGFNETAAALPQDRPRSTDIRISPQRSSILPTLRQLAVEGRSLQGSLTNRGPLAAMPPGLPDRVEGWERAVSTALESRPNLRAQFEATPGARFAILHSATDDLHHRLEARLGVLEAIVQGLAGPGGED